MEVNFLSNVNHRDPFFWIREIGADEDSGIEGILSGLEKQRNIDFGFILGKNGYDVHPGNRDLNIGKFVLLNGILLIHFFFLLYSRNIL